MGTQPNNAAGNKHQKKPANYAHKEDITQGTANPTPPRRGIRTIISVTIVRKQATSSQIADEEPITILGTRETCAAPSPEGEKPDKIHHYQ